MSKTNLWKFITIVEFVAALIVVLLDLFIPTLVIFGMMVISLLLRHEKISVLGIKRPKSWLILTGISFLSVVFLQLFDVGVLMPILNRLTETTINYSGFAGLQGNVQQLILYLVLAWTLAGLCEEIVFRGYFQKLLGELFGDKLLGIVLTFGLSSVIFGLAHLEQGIIGVMVTTFDAIIFSLLKRKFDNNLWAAILAHGFYNTIGTVVFYFTGPIYGFW